MSKTKMQIKSFIKRVMLFASAREKKQIILGKLYPFVREYYDNGVRIVNIPGFFGRGDIFAYRSLVGRLAPDSTVIEVGTWKGKSLANVAIEEKKNICLIAIDIFLGSKNERWSTHKEASLSSNGIYFKFLRNMLRHKIGNFSVLRMESIQAASLFRNGIADLVFIDAGHSYDEVVEDILLWKPIVKEGGFLAGHDYRNENAIVQAVKDTLGSYKIETFPDSSIWAVRV